MLIKQKENRGRTVLLRDPKVSIERGPYVPANAHRHARLRKQHPRHATAVRVQNPFQQRHQLGSPRGIEGARQIQNQDRQAKLELGRPLGHSLVGPQ